ncbi:MAG: D-glycero-beta-D-manno-heptose 1-phosphate adenylyltransferase [Chitinophagales bacterium]|nr:D-glycero-beta-D-manno-heptose 1-phosphate adenylyltransferase [Chitinophagales bacterium]MDW8426945.1 D-glycero-beta-D-manno-heptose 1-phosphate adenylyltransferase [Chitinophagales bacterium]
MRLQDKICNLNQLEQKVHQWRQHGKKIVFTNGCFDLLHAGHLHLLHQARSYGDVLIVGLNADASVRRLKPGRPLVAENDRLQHLAALEAVDAVILFHEDTPLALIERIRPDVLVKGADYRPEEVIGRDLVHAYGGTVALVPLLPGYSTTALIERIKKT